MLAHVSGDFRVLPIFSALTHNPRYTSIATPLILFIYIYLFVYYYYIEPRASLMTSTLQLACMPKALLVVFILRQVSFLSCLADLKLTL